MPQEVEARVKEIIPRTYNVKSFRFDVGQVVAFKAGQFLCATLKTEASCKRYLSISNSPTETGYIEFTKKITGSDFSKALEALKIGDVLYINYPSGNFILKDPKEKIAFLSGGIGITPIRSICKYVVDTNLGTDMVLLYANRAINDIAFKEDFDVMQRDYPRLKVCHVLSESAPGFKCSPGRIDSGLIKSQIPDYLERKFYLCGPPVMVEAMKKILVEELALPQGHIVTENFKGY